MTNELYIKIMQYVDEEMDPAERTVFEDTLKLNKDLFKEVEVYMEIKGLGKKMRQESPDFSAVLTDDIKVKHKEMLNMIHQGRIDWESKQLNWIDELIKKALQSDKIPDNPPDSLRMGFLEYKKKNYKRAIENFEDVGLRGTKDDEDDNLTAFYSSYYKGLSYMAEDDFAKAILALEEAITESPDELWKSKGQWFLALAYLKTNDPEKARELLKQVAENEQEKEYKTKAQDLLKELKM